ncbi:MAG: DNA-3-methyladenine glycosylase 2 family protein [Bacteroidota bacterium]
MNSIVNQKDIEKLLKADAVFTKIYDQYGPPPDWSRPQGFITLSKIILEQQVSLQSSNAHFNKLNSYMSAFTPEEIVKLSDNEMRHCQISKQKSTYLRELSLTIIDRKIELDRFSGLPVDEVRQQLKCIKGIGDWTVDIYMMFCLQAKDIFSSGDVAVINTVKELTNAGSKAEIVAYVSKWKPYRSLATHFLWHYYLSKRNRSSML